MACLNMFNNEQHQNLGPRISFSNDFADPKLSTKLENNYREAPVSSDFDFSLPSYAMISADELFFKGKLLPMKGISNKAITTLRDELLSGDDDLEDLSPSIMKGAGRWREKLGLRRSNIVLKKADKISSGGLESIDEMKKPDNIFTFKGEKICQY